MKEAKRTTTVVEVIVFLQPTLALTDFIVFVFIHVSLNDCCY